MIAYSQVYCDIRGKEAKCRIIYIISRRKREDQDQP